MLNIAIVEDNRQDRDLLVRALQEYEMQHDLHFSIKSFEDGEDIAVDYKAGQDIIFLDIEMPFMDGMSAAGKIREKDPAVILIFLTNMPQFVMHGYKVEALDYLLKPVSYFALSETLKRALSRIKRKKKHFVTIRGRDGSIRIDPSEILYVEVIDHYVVYHTMEDDVTSRDTMNNAENLLKPYGFSRCSQSYLVNLDHVRRVSASEVYVENVVLTLGRTKKKEFMAALTRYMNEADL